MLKELVPYFQGLTLVFAILFYRKHQWTNYYKYFVLYIGLLCGFELFAQFFITKDTFYLNNIYNFFEYNLIALIYFKLAKNIFYESLIKSLMLLFNLVFIISFIFIELQNYTFFVGNIIINILMIFYFKELLYSDEIINFKRDLSFWLTVAFMFYFLTTTPFFVVIYIIKIGSRADNILLYNMLFAITIITHLLLIFGLLWSRKRVR